jgi:hypothetical protein
MADLTYEIDELGAVVIFSSESSAPVIYQPTWPDNTPFAEGEADLWAQAQILAMTDDTAPLAGVSPSEPTRIRPIEELVIYTGDPDVEVE